MSIVKSTNECKPIIFSIEGNIGVGKSTMLNNIKTIIGNSINGKKCVFIQEPVDEWQSIKDLDGENILTKFYKDQVKYGFSFQMMAYISRQALLMDTVENNPNSIIITERCIHTDKKVFAKMLYDDNKIEEVNYQIYNKWFETFSNKYEYTGHIYLRASPETCYNRVMSRSRTGEEIPLEYLTRCHDNHDNWLSYAKNTILISVDADMKDAADKYNDIYFKIKTHIINAVFVNL
jgi:deoxyadenosine/deoxycytidine kinase